jgi:hypothetical protein
MTKSFTVLLPLIVIARVANAWIFQKWSRTSFTNQRNTEESRFSRLSHIALSLQSSPQGKVKDPDDWVQCVSKSLHQFYGKSLYEELSLDGPEQVHVNEQHVVISHGNQDDPIYNYANQAGLLFFGYREEEFVQLPSRYSAPDGALRDDRSIIVQHVLDHGWSIIPQAIRQTKSGDCYFVHRILYFNVYDDEGSRIGQAATFDRNKVELIPVEATLN